MTTITNIYASRQRANEEYPKKYNGVKALTTIE